MFGLRSPSPARLSADEPASISASAAGRCGLLGGVSMLCRRESRQQGAMNQPCQGRESNGASLRQKVSHLY